MPVNDPLRPTGLIVPNCGSIRDSAIHRPFQQVLFYVEQDGLDRALARAFLQSMTLSLETRDCVGRKPVALIPDPIGQPLVVEPRCVDRLLDVHPEVDDR